MLRVHSRKGHGIECRLPAAPPTISGSGTISTVVSPSPPLRADPVEGVAAGAAQPPDEEAEARQLAATLLGRPVDNAIMATLQAGVDRHPNNPGALLRRLRTAKQWARASKYVAEMATILEHPYWI